MMESFLASLGWCTIICGADYSSYFPSCWCSLFWSSWFYFVRFSMICFSFRISCWIYGGVPFGFLFGGGIAYVRIRLSWILGILLEAIILLGLEIAWKIASKELFCLYLFRISRGKGKGRSDLTSMHCFFALDNSVL